MKTGACLLLLIAVAGCATAMTPLQAYVNENAFDGDRLMAALMATPESEIDEENWAMLDALSVEDVQHIVQYLVKSLVEAMPPTDTSTPEWKAAMKEIVGKHKAKVDNGESVIDPVVFVPGFLASGLHCHKDGADTVRTCPGNRQDYQCWLSIPKIVRLRCFFQEFSRVFNNGVYGYTMDGYEVDGEDFGGVDGVIDIQKFIEIPMMEGMIEAFEDIGYQRDVSFRAATYDWTFTGDVYANNNGVQPLYALLKNLIEETYRINGNKRVNLVGHSMGTYQGHWFLTSGYVNATWKSQYIKNMIDITPLYKGAPLSHRALLTGLTPIPTVKWYLRNLVTNWGSVHFFLPFNWPNQTFVITDQDRYNDVDTEVLYRDADKPHISEAYNPSHRVTAQMIPHGVPYHCFIGTNVTTEYGVDYRGTRAPRFWYQTPVSIPGDGDALVPSVSARACQELGPQTFAAYPGINHLAMLNHPPFLDIMMAICTA